MTRVGTGGRVKKQAILAETFSFTHFSVVSSSSSFFVAQPYQV
jgi:hypothetical protein